MIPKKNPADIEADRIMALQRSVSAKSRPGDCILIAVCALLLVIFGVGIYLLPHSDFSEEENTSLQTFPRLSTSGKFLDRVWDGRFMSELKDFYTDQFPLRDQLVGAKAALELAMGKQENNDVIFGREGYLIKRIEYDEKQLQTLRGNLEAVASFRAALEAQYGDEIDVHLALAPRAIDVLGAYLPPLFSPARAEAVWEVVADYTEAAAVTSLRPIIEPLAKIGEPVWYRTDHHWTTLGAYHAYAALGSIIGYTPTPLDRFTVETASDSFLGTTYSAGGFKCVAPEQLCFYRYAGDEDYVVEILARDEVIRTLDGFYDRSYLEKKDKYAAFLSSNNAHMRVRSTAPDAEERPTLLLIKDSFSHAVVPFLAQHYQLEILDLRYYRQTVASFLEEHSVDGVLILCGLDSLATSDLLAALPVGMGIGVEK